MTDKPIAEMTVNELLHYEARYWSSNCKIVEQDAAVNELARRATAGEAAAKERDANIKARFDAENFAADLRRESEANAVAAKACYATLKDYDDVLIPDLRAKLTAAEKQRDAALERLRMLAHSACVEWTSGPGINGILVTDRSWDALGAELKLTRKFLERIESQPAEAQKPPPADEPKSWCKWCGHLFDGFYHDCKEGREPSKPSPDPADTAASALADVQAIREQQRRLESRSYGANERIDGACMRIASLERGHGEYGGTVAEIWLKIATLEQANRDAYESYGLLRDRVAALEGKS